MDIRVENMKQYLNPVLYDSSKENCEICYECAMERPVCCQMLPCYLSPSDIKDLSVDGIIHLIDTGIVSIDWYDREDDAKYEVLRNKPMQHFFLRMRGKGRRVIDPSIIMNPCCLWDKDKGCPIEFSYRPKGARELIPARGCECKSTYEKDACAVEWHPYADVLRKVYDHYLERGEVESSDPLTMLFNMFAGMESLMQLANERQGD